MYDGHDSHKILLWTMVRRSNKTCLLQTILENVMSGHQNSLKTQIFLSAGNAISKKCHYKIILWMLICSIFPVKKTHFQYCEPSWNSLQLETPFKIPVQASLTFLRLLNPWHRVSISSIIDLYPKLFGLVIHLNTRSQTCRLHTNFLFFSPEPVSTFSFSTLDSES